jgi:hypothetical protein
VPLEDQHERVVSDRLAEYVGGLRAGGDDRTVAGGQAVEQERRGDRDQLRRRAE